MAVIEHKISLQKLKKTQAFKRRNGEWPSTCWDYTEWEECLEEARSELKRK